MNNATNACGILRKECASSEGILLRGLHSLHLASRSAACSFSAWARRCLCRGIFKEAIITKEGRLGLQTAQQSGACAGLTHAPCASKRGDARKRWQRRSASLRATAVISALWYSLGQKVTSDGKHQPSAKSVYRELSAHTGTCGLSTGISGATLITCIVAFLFLSLQASSSQLVREKNRCECRGASISKYSGLCGQGVDLFTLLVPPCGSATLSY